ncbi:unnamed protein product, partial [Ectocarpus sp. 12 AP-2014]
MSTPPTPAPVKNAPESTHVKLGHPFPPPHPLSKRGGWNLGDQYSKMDTNKILTNTRTNKTGAPHRDISSGRGPPPQARKTKRRRASLHNDCNTSRRPTFLSQLRKKRAFKILAGGVLAGGR